ncbi:MAG TPA: hypothetical protein VNV41_04380 [Candidatus Acidoferrales bacterium]|jgi:hypothetical protein|nr:hypothetical protein [Candidatus Acidoferrales bacterium]
MQGTWSNRACVQPVVTSAMLANLNRRHKVGLFLVLVAAGLSLFLEASAKQTAGIILLGLAGAWLLGSLKLRTLWLVSSILACVVGLGIVAIPVIDDSNSIQYSVQSYDNALSDLGRDVSSARAIPQYTVDPPDETTLSYDSSTRKWVPDITFSAYATTKGQWQDRSAKNVPKSSGADHDDWVDVGTTVVIPPAAMRWERHDLPSVVKTLSFSPSVDQSELIDTIQNQLFQPKPKFSVSAALGANLGFAIVGLSLFVAGLFSLGWCIRSGRRSR